MSPANCVTAAVMVQSKCEITFFLFFFSKKNPSIRILGHKNVDRTHPTIYQTELSLTEYQISKVKFCTNHPNNEHYCE